MLQRAIHMLPILLLPLLWAPSAARAGTDEVASRLDRFWQRRAKVVHAPLLPRKMAVEVSTGAHIVFTDAQAIRFPLGLRVALHFNQSWGIELAGDWVLSSARGERAILAEWAPRELREQPAWRAAVAALWSPLLGKVSGGQQLLAFEPYVALGAGIAGSAAEARAEIESAVRPEGILTLGLRIGRGRWLARLELRQMLRLRPKDRDLEYALGVGLLVGVLLGGTR